MKYIDSLREGMRISEVYLCKSKQIAQTKAGKDYGNLVLQDKTGTIDSKIWDLGSPGICNFEAMDYVAVDADVTMFQGNNQLNIRRIRVADEGEYIPADYLPVSTKDIPKMYEELVGYVKSIKNPYLNKLAAGYFVDDPAFAKAFQFHSAAKSVHHGFVGGLLEHTLSVVKMCDYFAGFYKEINRDLLLTAAMFHDIGKTKELSVFPENDYTDDGQLLGHIMSCFSKSNPSCSPYGPNGFLERKMVWLWSYRNQYLERKVYRITDRTIWALTEQLKKVILSQPGLRSVFHRWIT